MTRRARTQTHTYNDHKQNPVATALAFTVRETYRMFACVLARGMELNFCAYLFCAIRRRWTDIRWEQAVPICVLIAPGTMLCGKDVGRY